MTPQRIQLSRVRGWRKPEGAVVVSRPSKWGNPWIVTLCHRTACGPASGWCVSSNAGHSHVRCDCYDDAARSAVASYVEANAHPNRVAEIQGALRGRDLACWCPTNRPCHADVLLELANGESA